MRRSKLGMAVESLETRNLLTGGSVVQTGALVTITPAPGGPNSAVVSYASVAGVTKLDVNLNGVDYFFNPSQIGAVYYEGSGLTGNQSFANSARVEGVAWGGVGSNNFVGGPALNEFYGGAGPDTFNAGTGFTYMLGGVASNTFVESQTGSGEIVEEGNQNTIVVPPGQSGHYVVVVAQSQPRVVFGAMSFDQGDPHHSAPSGIVLPLIC